MNGTHDDGVGPFDAFGQDPSGDAEFEDPQGEPDGDGSEFDDDLLEEELRQAVAILDPLPAELRQVAMEAYALYDMDARLAELTFDSLVDSVPVRGVTDVPRMLTFTAGGLSVDVEVTSEGLMGQVMPPQPVGIEVLSGPQAPRPTTLTADSMGRFTSDVTPAGPFALRLRTGGEVVVTEWLRA
ncbi:hypothetical protein ACIQPR_42765 [Streptomyces sp. NPDC091280]|uniref:hypothetical protein n=1 Tax=Streptomyces sp. NPDC091280 TaxID=3365984 RepID=UPI0038290913